MQSDPVTRLKAKIEDLISRYENLENLYARSNAALTNCEQELQKKDIRIKELEKQIGDLRLKDAFLATSEDRTQAKRKVAGLIKEIDECVKLLSE